MKRMDEIKFEMLSNIDDHIIEMQSEKRYRLMKKPRYSRKKLTAWISVAACFLILFSVGLGLFATIWQKQVPVYRGMTVANASGGVQLHADIDDVMHERLLLSNGTLPTARTGEEGTGGETTEDTRLPDPPDLIGENRSLYYAHKNEDIYITVHLDNPDQYEILSFTLNGKKYQSYMFEEGSTSEALILKVNVGDVEGMVEYTIDAIKYVDGDVIKDVRMDGSRTVSVGVYPENQPTVAWNNQILDIEELSFDVTLTDALSLIANSKGTLRAELYLGETKISSQALSITETTSVRFTGMIPGETYHARIVAEYDAFDGRGFGAYVLSEKEIVAKLVVELTDVAVSNRNNVVFDLRIADGYTASVSCVELIRVGGGVELSISGTARVFESISLGTYILKATYTYGTDGKTGYAYSSPIEIKLLGQILEGAQIVREYSGDMQIPNPTTNDYRAHRGIDLISDTSSSVHAAFTGRITEVSSSGVVLSSLDGTVQLVYESLSEISVREGDFVSNGQQLGSLGNTFWLEIVDAKHVHVELWINGTPQDPTEYFR